MTDETTIPDVGVVIPCYNAERWVGRAIDSVLAQEDRDKFAPDTLTNIKPIQLLYS